MLHNRLPDTIPGGMTMSFPITLHEHITVADADRLRLFVASITDYAIYMLSPEGIVTSWNAGAQRFKGYAPDEIIGRHFSAFYTPEDRANGVPARALRTALETGKFEDEGWRMRKDGTRFWAHVVIDPIRDSEGKLAGFAKITRDITEKKQTLAALHASEERFRLLVQGVTDYAIYMLSPEGNVTNWNAGARRIKGYADTEVIGSHFSRFYPPEDREAGKPARALETARTMGRFEGEGWRVRKDGTRFWAHVVIDPIRSELGDLIGFAKITRDITERRDAAEALERAREALFQAQKLEAIGKLTGGVAHDFNNLLGVIISGLEIIAGEVASPAGQRVLESMQRAAERGSTLTRQLLTFARKQPLRQEQTDINAVIQSFEAVLRRASRGAIRFDFRLADGLPPVLMDAPQFEAALLNLIVNARDATPDDGRIVLSTETVQLAEFQVARLPAGRYVRVAVSDTGCGMPPEVVERALEPFFTTKEVGKGTGMGLSQVYGFIQGSGGDMTIDSRVDEGTTVALYLPAIAGAERGDQDDDRQPEETERALVVDDQPEMLAVAIEVFRNLGYTVLSAGNGKDALDILERTAGIDVLFSDVVMPGMNGIELARQARRLHPEIRILLASGYTAPALAEEHADLKSVPLVTKPYRTSEILKKLRTAH